MKHKKKKKYFVYIIRSNFEVGIYFVLNFNEREVGIYFEAA